MKIEELGLSVRAYNCLNRAGVSNIYEMGMLKAIDSKVLEDFGYKTRKEIENKILELKNNGTYSQEFIENFLSDVEEDYIEKLDLSNRSKNILRTMEIKNASQLLSLDENTLYRVRNSGKSSINEIMTYILNNKDELFRESIINGNIKYEISIKNYYNFSSALSLNMIPMSSNLLKELNCNNINNLGDLILNKIEVQKFNEIEYSKIYEYFHNLAYGKLLLNYAQCINNYYIKLPFGLKKYKENDTIQVLEFVTYATQNFSSFTIEEMVNVKLYLLWLNTFKNENIEDYFFEILELTDKQKNIVGKRIYMTLEEIGEKFDLTRERIRQIEKKTTQKIEKISSNFPFKFLDLRKIYNVEEASDRELLLLYLDDKTDKNFFYYKNNNKKLFVPTYHLNRINSLLENNKIELENNGYIIYENANYKEILKYTLEYMELNLCNNKLSKKLTKRNQVKYAMRYIGRPISLSSESDLKEVSATVLELFGTELTDNSRGLEALITEAGVRIDSGTYAADDPVVPLDLKTLGEIEEYVKEREIINSRDLFIKFGNIFDEHNIKNESILYRYLKEELNDKLFFNGVSAVISSSPNLSCWGDVVIREIKNTGKPFNKLDFMVKYSITDAVYLSLATNFDDIITWSSKELFLKSMIELDEKTKENLYVYLREKQIASFSEIKNHLNIIEQDFLKKYSIVSNVNLYNFLQNTLSEEFIIDKEREEVRVKRNQSRIINETYENIEELTL